MRRTSRTLLGLGLAGLFLWLILRQVDSGEMLRILGGARPDWTALAIAAFFCGYACRIERWRLLLCHDNPTLRWRHCAGPLLASVAANNVLPFRLGDLLRLFGFNARLGIGTTTAFASLFQERLLDLLVLLIILGVLPVALGLDISRLMGAGTAVFLAGASLILGLLLRPTAIHPPVKIIVSFVTRWHASLGQQLDRESARVFTLLTQSAQPRLALRLLMWSMLAWLIEGLVFYCCALALPAITQPAAAWLALPLGTLATLLPSSPGYLGTFDYFTAWALSSAGNTATASATYAFFVHAILWGPVTLAGGCYVIARPVGVSAKRQGNAP